VPKGKSWVQLIGPIKLRERTSLIPSIPVLVPPYMIILLLGSSTIAECQSLPVGIVPDGLKRDQVSVPEVKLSARRSLRKDEPLHPPKTIILLFVESVIAECQARIVGREPEGKSCNQLGPEMTVAVLENESEQAREEEAVKVTV